MRGNMHAHSTILVHEDGKAVGDLAAHTRGKQQIGDEGVHVNLRGESQVHLPADRAVCGVGPQRQRLGVVEERAGTS